MNTELPKPSANQKEYQRIFERGMKRYPERRLNYDKYLKAQAMQNGIFVLDYMPIKMDYEVSSLCNFRCEMCLMSEVADRRKHQMSYDEFKASLDEQIGLVEVKLQGLGEPLLNGDFFKMARECVNRDIWVRTTTNGSLLDREDNYKRMIDEQIGEIQVSIDGGSKEVFEKIRKGSDFDRVVANVTKMNRYAKSKDEGWRTSLWMLVQKDNLHEMRDVLYLAEKMCFTRMVYSLAVVGFGHDELETINRPKNVRDQLQYEEAVALIDEGKKRGIEVSFWIGDDKYEFTEDHKRICNWLWSRSVITGEGRILPCCVLYDCDELDLGDGYRFRAEWNNEQYQALRRAHWEGDIPMQCRGCYAKQMKSRVG